MVPARSGRGTMTGTYHSRAEEALDINKILVEIREERKQIEAAIVSLQRLAAGEGKRRGRPPAWMKDLKKPDTNAKPRGRPPKNKTGESSLKNTPES
jgi:hypothetical protein